MDSVPGGYEKRYRKEAGKAEVWKYVKRMHRPLKNARGTLCHHVCTMCISQGKSFDESILPVFFKRNSSGVLVARSANANHHMYTKHTDFWLKATNGKRKLPTKTKKPKAIKKKSGSSSKGKKVASVSTGHVYDTHIALIRFVLQNHLPLSVCCTEPTANFLFGLAGSHYTKLEPSKRNRLLDIYFARMIKKVTKCVQETRSHYRKNMQDKSFPCQFLSVVHSKWQPESQSSLWGVSLRWVDPVTFQQNHVALGINDRGPESVSVSETMKVAGGLLKKFQIEDGDILACVRCIPSSYPVPEDVNIKRMNVVQMTFLDSLKPLHPLIEASRNLILYFMESNASWSEYVSRAQENGRSVLPFKLENEDHIVGLHKMILLLIRSYHCIGDYFAGKSSERENLSAEQWLKLVMLEGIMRPVVQLDMSIPNYLPTSSMSWLHFKRAIHVCTKDVVRVVALEKGEWGGESPPEFLPRIKLGMGNLEQDIGSVYSSFRQALEERTPEPSEKLLVSMMCDPIVMTAGKVVVQTDSKIWEEAQRLFHHAVVEEASNLSEASMETSADVENVTFETGIGSNEVDDYVSQLRVAEVGRGVVSAGAEGDSVAEELSRWFILKNIDWEEEYFLQSPVADIKSQRRGQLFDRSRIEDVYYLYGKINPLAWWERKRKEYPIIHRVASKYLSLPVEHFGTHFTSSLFVNSYKIRNLGPRRYEQTCLQSFNASWFTHVDEMSDQAVRNIICKGRKGIEDYVKTIFAFFGETIEQNGQPTLRYAQVIEAFVNDLAVKAQTGEGKSSKSSKRKRVKRE